ncbi:MAG: hypothetical protein KAY37_13375 [Phycisphaerae bacterium]|nr:hypothetical protein [Phycisphaerae bacterium]
MQAQGLRGQARGRALFAVTLLAAVVASAAGRSGNYLIITAEDYNGSAPLTQFANAKAAMGFTVSTQVAVPGTTNTAIKTYIESLWGTHGAPDYILLVGDTAGSSATSNTIPHCTGGGSKQAPTDLPYGCMDGADDWHPDIAVGRFSVTSVSMLQDVVDKSLFVEAGNFPDHDYVKRGAFLANPSTCGMAEPTHDWVIENYFEPNGYQGIKIYSAEGGDTQDVTDAVNNGCLWIGYYGHSGSSGWWDPSYGHGNVEALSNYGLYGVAWSFSCNVGNFTVGRCFGETWLREADKGAAAVIFPSGFIYWGSTTAWEPSTVLEHSFFRAFFEDDIWEVGPAWQAGLYHFLTDFGGSDDIKRNFFELYNLLGDPALLLPQSYGFTLAVDPTSQNVCAPDDAVYTIDVEPLGGFEAPVTLVASGQPAEASIHFSVNPVSPPGTTVMTVGNTGAATAGRYSIEITGSAPEVQRSTVVELGLSNSAPGPVTLTSPPNGALDVARMPTLAWQPVGQALDYDLEVATDAGFLNVVYSTTVTDESHMVSTMLDSDTLYYWHVRAVNGCGDSGFSQTYTFTTIDQPDYFTEQFTSGFDLENFSVTFIPGGSGNYYSLCGEEITELPTDPSGGTTLPLSDDDYESVSPSTNVWLYGTSYSSFYVGSNGYITFGSGDTDYNESLTDHFNRPRVSAVFDDLNPSSGGTVSWKETADHVAVTWENVPEFSSGNSNTFQIELYFDGKITISWLRVDSNDSVVGLSQGLGMPADYIASDLSAAGPCRCPGDSNCDGAISWRDIDFLVAALNDNVAAWEAMFAPGSPSCPFSNNDVNDDGSVNWRDVDPFVAVINTTCP